MEKIRMTQTIQSRYYQTEAIELLQESMAKGNKRIILCAPTGSGKSIVMAEMAKRAYDKGKRVIILTHRIELLKATLQHIKNCNIYPVELIAGSKIPNADWKVMIAMEKTLWNRIKKGAEINPDLIIADEIHFKNFSKIINYYKDSYLIGFSATPSGNHIHKIYQDIINNIDIPELIQEGFLTPCKAYQMIDNFDDVKIKMGEFENTSLYNHFNTPKLYDHCVREYLEKTPNKKALVFCCNIAHTIKTNEKFNKAGIHSEIVTSETKPQERDRIITAFRTGCFPVLCNCGILTTGFSDDNIEVIILNRATLSLPLFLQMQGRGSRIYPNKKFFITLDFGCNHDRFGLWSSEREWSLDPPKPKKQGVAPVKSCPRCSAMLHARAIKCEFCGYIFPLPAQSTLKDGVLVEVAGDNNPFEGRKISELSLKELVQLSKTKKIKTPYIWRVVRAKGYDAVQNYGWLMGYKNGWAFNQQKELNDCSFRDRIL